MGRDIHAMFPEGRLYVVGTLQPAETSFLDPGRLSAAEAQGLNLSGVPLCLEHSVLDQVGTVERCWLNGQGDLCCSATLEGEQSRAAQARLLDGTLRGLSLSLRATREHKRRVEVLGGVKRLAPAASKGRLRRLAG